MSLYRVNSPSHNTQLKKKKVVRQYVFKVLVVGEVGSGRHSLITRYTQGTFDESQQTARRSRTFTGGEDLVRDGSSSTLKEENLPTIENKYTRSLPTSLKSSSSPSIRSSVPLLSPQRSQNNNEETQVCKTSNLQKERAASVDTTADSNNNNDNNRGEKTLSQSTEKKTKSRSSLFRSLKSSGDEGSNRASISISSSLRKLTLSNSGTKSSNASAKKSLSNSPTSTPKSSISGVSPKVPRKKKVSYNTQIGEHNVIIEFYMPDDVQSLSKEFLSSVNGFIFVYDVTSQSSLREITNNFNFLKKTLLKRSQLCAVMVGTKIDLAEYREIPFIEVENISTEYNVNYYECSAASNSGVKSIFQSLFNFLEYEIITIPKIDEWKREVRGGSLQQAILVHNTQKVANLLVSGKSPDKISKDGWAPIHFACWEGYVDIVTLFLQVAPSSVNVKSKEGWTPLHIASKRGFLNVVRILIDSGMEVSSSESNQKNSCSSTCYRNIRDLIRTKSEIIKRNKSSTTDFLDLFILNLNPDQTTELDLCYSQYHAIPTSILQHRMLTELDLSSNNIVDIPPVITELQNLKKLQLSYNQIAITPSEIALLTQLEYLDLRHNKISSLPSTIGDMSSLKILLLSNNALTYLPSQICNLENTLELLDVYNNPFGTIPVDIIPKVGEVHPADLVPLFNYLRNISDCDAVEYNRVKLMFVGDGNVGKTSLLNCFLEKDARKKRKLGVNNEKKEPTETIATDGIDISELNYSLPNGNEIIWDCWDYAGQEIYYTTHQFFLSKRSVYLIIFNLLDNNTSRVEYWINSIHTRARGSPMILVGTHADHKDCTKEYINSYIENLSKNIKLDRFKSKLGIKSIKGIVTVSSKKKTGTKELLDLIADVAFKCKFTGQVFPSTWLKLENALSVIRNNGTSPCISYSEFADIALSCSVIGKSVSEVIKFLHRIGSLCYFDDARSKLKDLVIIDPQFLTNVMSTIITMKHRYGQETDNEGIIYENDLPQIWKDYSFDLRRLLMGLLESFEIAFFLPDGDDNDPVASNNRKMVIPALLGESQPPLKDLWNVIRGKKPEGIVYGRNYTFEFMPLGFFARLFGRNFHLPDIRVLTYWRNGMLLQKGNTKCLLRYHPSKYVLSSEVHNRFAAENANENYELVSFLRLIIDNIEAVIEGWYETKISITIPCTHCLLEGDYSPYTYTLDECIDAIHNNIGYVLCNKVRRIRIDTITPDFTFADLRNFLVDYKDLEISRTVGSGAFGIVYFGLLKSVQVAIKVLLTSSKSNSNSNSSNSDNSNNSLSNTEGSNNSNNNSSYDTKLMNDPNRSKIVKLFLSFQKEIWIMSNLSHTNICSLLAVTQSPISIIMEYINLGDLFHIIDFLSQYLDTGAVAEPIDNSEFEGEDERKPKYQINELLPLLDFRMKLKIAYQIALGVNHLHQFSPPIAHRDLRSPNIFINKLDLNLSDIAKVGDFGLSRLNLSNTLSGGEFNLNWLAPEVMEDKEYTEKIDVYSFAIIMWELMSLQRPFEEYDHLFAGKPQNLFKSAVVSGLRPSISINHEPINDSSANVICSTIKATVSQRDSLKNATLSEETISQYTEYIRIMKQCWSNNPDDRPTFNQIVKDLRSLLISIGVSCDDASSLAPSHDFGTSSRDNEVFDLTQLSKTVLVHDRTITTQTDVLKIIHCTLSSEKEKEIYSKVWIALAGGAVSIISLSNYELECVVPVSSEKDRIYDICQVVNTVWISVDSGSIYIYSIKDLSKIQTINEHSSKLVRSILCTPAGKVVTADIDGNIVMWKIASNNKKAKIQSKAKVGRPVSVMTYIEDTNNIIIGTDGPILIFSLSSNSVVMKLEGHNGMVSGIFLVNNMIWSSSYDSSISVWNAQTGNREGENMKAHSSKVLALINYRKYAFSSSFDKSIIVWDCSNRIVLQDIQDHNHGVKSLQVINNQLWSGSLGSKSAIHIYNIIGDVQ